MTMSARLSRSLPLPPRASSLMINENVPVPKGEKPGIVTVLGCDPGTDRAASLRRTLSADMSSREWRTKNGFHALKKTESSVSTKDSSSSSSDDEEETLRKDVEGCGGQVYMWKARRDEGESEKRAETWSSIMFHKVVDSKSLPPPYVHPMVKRSKSCLSTKSLEVCTESLGSETGSDGFSSYPASEVGDLESEEGHETRALAFDIEDVYAAKWNNMTAFRKTRPQSFPPPIQSLSQGNRGGSVSMHSRRDNGRLVLEAVSVPSERNFEARREEGRLVLTFANDNESYGDEDMDEDEDEDELVMEMDEDIYTKEDNNEEEFRTEFASEGIGGGLVNIQKLSKMLNNPITMVNRDPGRQGKYGGGAFDWEEDEAADPIQIQLEQSLPLNSPMSRMLQTPNSVPSATMSPDSLNAYEYFWRNKTPGNTFIASPIGQPLSLSTLKGHCLNISVYEKNLASDEAHINRSLSLTRRDGYLSPLLQSCNSPSRTNLLWETKCIATS